MPGVFMDLSSTSNLSYLQMPLAFAVAFTVVVRVEIVEDGGRRNEIACTEQQQLQRKQQQQLYDYYLGLTLPKAM